MLEGFRVLEVWDGSEGVCVGCPVAVLGVLEGFAAFDSFPEVFRRAATVVWHIRVTSVSIPLSGGQFQQVDNLEPPQCWG